MFGLAIQTRRVSGRIARNMASEIMSEILAGRRLVRHPRTAWPADGGGKGVLRKHRQTPVQGKRVRSGRARRSSRCRAREALMPSPVRLASAESSAHSRPDSVRAGRWPSDGDPRFRAHSKRVFIGRELDDPLVGMPSSRDGVIGFRAGTVRWRERSARLIPKRHVQYSL